PLAEGMVSVYFEPALECQDPYEGNNFSVLTFTGRYENVSTNSSSVVGVARDPRITGSDTVEYIGKPIVFGFDILDNCVFMGLVCDGKALVYDEDYYVDGDKREITLDSVWLDGLYRDTKIDVHFGCGPQRTDVSVPFTVKVSKKVDVVWTVPSDRAYIPETFEESDGCYLLKKEYSVGQTPVMKVPVVGLPYEVDGNVVYHYEFAGWSVDGGETVGGLVRVSKDDIGSTVVFTAVFDKVYDTFDVTWYIDRSTVFVQTLTYCERTEKGDDGRTVIVYGAPVERSPVGDDAIEGWVYDVSGIPTFVSFGPGTSLFVYGPTTFDAYLCEHQGKIVKVPGIPPTCVDKGVKEHYECSMCHALFEDELGAHPVELSDLILPETGHILVIDPAVAATCTDTGLTEGAHCSVCGLVLVEQKTVPTIPHTPSNAVIENYVEPTLDNDGSYDLVVRCAVCGIILSSVHVTLECIKGACGDGVYWVLWEDGRLVISGTGPMSEYPDGAPWRSYRSSITAVEVREGVTYLCEDAFYKYPNVCRLS
ncbi:MAG: hypothetical protein MJZ68_09820, partial [archaeon]|nr:hypothetical protein [archaeon]